MFRKERVIFQEKPHCWRKYRLTIANLGCYTFLKEMDIAFRRDLTTLRPHVNKENSQMDNPKRRRRILLHQNRQRKR